MTQLKSMIQSHPEANGERNALTRCIESCLECSQICVSCADACLGEPQLEMLRRCIRLNLDCSDVCAATGRVLIRLGQPDRLLLQRAVGAASAATLACAEECEQHADEHQHCRICAETCVRCAEACNALLEELA